ncbi:hypothetical protein ISF_05422 [Cordyceps fumosorosea ARSEF 2679]|uniref:Uncharacterized protein n=1 Tax=Cordyceps fumosorosea (strain ARSEF 2679) TaxID=1081104 RepID=A0A167U8W0_CORFA|nr:hypothetical protein ISF_05422 [Cordyceps fumosorosea ARSEF 2679]OAA61343.1 hypothetical protein ISF_05422 [Cordyceps fumosorosea ARSEF 2679]
MKSFSILLLTAGLVSAVAVPGASIADRSAEVGHVSAAVEARDAPVSSLLDEDDEEEFAPLDARAEESQQSQNGTASESGRGGKKGEQGQKGGQGQENQNQGQENQGQENQNQQQNNQGQENQNQQQNNQNQQQNNQDLINQLLQNGNLNQGILNPWLVSNIGQLGAGQTISIGGLNSISLAQQLALVSQVQQLQTLQQLQLISQPQIVTVLNQGFVNNGATLAIVA